MWDELGIAPSGDPRTIRRAYAARLKTIDQDRDPEAFARLRRALEQALAEAGGLPPPRRSPPDRDPARDPDGPISTASRPPPEPRLPAEPTPVRRPDGAPDPGETEPADASASPVVGRAFDDQDRDRALLAALDAALDRRDAAEATRLCYRAAATGTLPLRDAPDTLERIFALAADGPALNPAAFRDLARCFGWDRPMLETSAVSPARRKVLSRLLAEDWYDALVASAARKTLAPRRKAKVARLMLGYIGRRGLPRVDDAALRACLDEYRGHRTWLADRIDPAWVDRLDIRLRGREIRSLVRYSLLIGLFLAGFLSVLAIEITEHTATAWYLLVAPFLAVILLWLLKLMLTELIRLSSLPGTSFHRAYAFCSRWLRPTRRGRH
jgi:hypothetical protein